MAKKPMTIMIIGLSVVFGGLIAFNVTKKMLMQHFFKNYEKPAVTVSSVTVNQKEWYPNLHAVGDFLAVNGVDINSEASGNVVKILFESGQAVKKDTLLIKIDDSIEQANLKFNQADLNLQKINYKRQSQLIKRNATSQSEVDAAQAQLLEAEANIEKTEADISQKNIRAPFTGRLGIRLINLGQFITPGQTSIVTLQSLDPLFLEFYIPEQLLPRVKINQDILFSIDNNPNKVFSGKITAINAKVDAQTHNVKIQATAPNCPIEVLNETNRSRLIHTQKLPTSNRTLFTCNTEENQQANLTDYAFIPGMFADIEIKQPPMHNALVLPSTAIAYSLYGNSVFLIESKDEENPDTLIVKRVFVTTGDQQGNQVLITKGLKAGERVVSAGEIKLENGTHVVINNDIPLDTDTTPKTLSE